LDILPLYILMLVIFPVVLLGMQRHPLMVLVPSALLYLAVQILGISVPAYPEGHVWYFNPLAWQFLFVSAALLGHAWTRGQRAAAARPLVLCGQHSLEIFCLGIILSALGHFIVTEYGSSVAMQLAVNAAGIAVMFLTARMIDWYKAMDRMPMFQPAGSRRSA